MARMNTPGLQIFRLNSPTTLVSESPPSLCHILLSTIIIITNPKPPQALLIGSGDEYSQLTRSLEFANAVSDTRL